MAGIKTQGSQLYALLPAAVGGALSVVAIQCIDSITLGGEPRDQIEDTCLEETDSRSYQQGLGTPASATVNLKADPRNPSHLALYNAYKSGVVVKWALGWSDGKDIAPTLDDGDFELPSTRTWNVFAGFVSDFPFDISANAIVATAATIQRSGGSNWVPKTT